MNGRLFLRFFVHILGVGSITVEEEDEAGRWAVRAFRGTSRMNGLTIVPQFINEIMFLDTVGAIFF